MHLVEAEALGPIEGDEPLVTPPRPPHRRVSVSFLFTITVLVTTVVAIYMLLPARHNVLVTEAIARHRDPGTWDLEAPSPAELRAWAIGVVGKDVPLPQEAAQIIGAKRLEIHRRGAALVRLQIGGEQVTYLVQNAHGIAPVVEQTDGDVRAFAWRTGKFTSVGVGSAAGSTQWLTALGAR